MRAAPATAQFEPLDRAHLDPGLTQGCVGAGVAVVADDDAGFDGDAGGRTRHESVFSPAPRPPGPAPPPSNRPNCPVLHRRREHRLHRNLQRRATTGWRRSCSFAGGEALRECCAAWTPASRYCAWLWAGWPTGRILLGDASLVLLAHRFGVISRLSRPGFMHASLRVRGLGDPACRHGRIRLGPMPEGVGRDGAGACWCRTGQLGGMPWRAREGGVLGRSVSFSPARTWFINTRVFSFGSA